MVASVLSLVGAVSEELFWRTFVVEMPAGVSELLGSDRLAHATCTDHDHDVVVHSSHTDECQRPTDDQVLMTGRLSHPRTVEVRACTAWS